MKNRKNTSRFGNMIDILTLVLFLLFFVHHWWVSCWIIRQCFVQIIIHHWQRPLLVHAKWIFSFLFLLLSISLSWLSF